MPAAAKLANEHSRIALLEALGILDTPAERDYDDIVAIAAAVCRVPMSTITLVDADRQWFKARIGIDDPQTPRDVSFCAHALLQPDELLVVGDASRDPRFADNPKVTAEGGIRFYAGAPVLAGEGVPIGTVCVVDSQPREIGEAEREALRALARQTSRLIEMRRLARMLDRQRREREWYEREMSQYRAALESRPEDIGRLVRIEPLTGLPNRRAFFSLLKGALNEGDGSRPVHVALVDLDHRDMLLEAHGQDESERILRELAATLRSGHAVEGTLARVGEEFALTMEMPRAQALAQCELVRGEVAAAQDGVPLTVSIGLATARAGEDAAELFVRAEQALRDARAAGGDRVVAAD